MGNLRRVSGVVPEEIVRAAMEEPGLRGRVFLCSTRREPLYCDDKIVGFVTPHETKSGWRHGPMFVLPEYRGRGLVHAYYAAHPERACVAFVPDGNEASRTMHLQAGFTHWKRGQSGSYMRREALAGEKTVATKKKAKLDQGTLKFGEESQDIDALAKKLAGALSALPIEARVDALNRVRTVLHEVSPFNAEPVDLVLWVKNETVAANDYNPNVVSSPELVLLQKSIEADGYTQPIVTHLASDPEDPAEECNEVVDGFHRNRCGKEVPAIRRRVHGYLPITRINVSRAGRNDRIAATIRHNRARGVHGVHSMSEIVRMLYLAGWDDKKIGAELGMQGDEVTRLKQITGLAALFADRDFSEAWEVDDHRGGAPCRG